MLQLKKCMYLSKVNGFCYLTSDNLAIQSRDYSETFTLLEDIRMCKRRGCRTLLHLGGRRDILDKSQIQVLPRKGESLLKTPEPSMQ